MRSHNVLAFPALMHNCSDMCYKKRVKMQTIPMIRFQKKMRCHCVMTVMTMRTTKPMTTNDNIYKYLWFIYELYLVIVILQFQT